MPEQVEAKRDGVTSPQNYNLSNLGNHDSLGKKYLALHFAPCIPNGRFSEKAMNHKKVSKLEIYHILLSIQWVSWSPNSFAARRALRRLLLSNLLVLFSAKFTRSRLVVVVNLLDQRIFCRLFVNAYPSRRVYFIIAILLITNFILLQWYEFILLLWYLW